MIKTKSTASAARVMVVYIPSPFGTGAHFIGEGVHGLCAAFSKSQGVLVLSPVRS